MEPCDGLPIPEAHGGETCCITSKRAVMFAGGVGTLCGGSQRARKNRCQNNGAPLLIEAGQHSKETEAGIPSGERDDDRNIPR